MPPGKHTVEPCERHAVRDRKLLGGISRKVAEFRPVVTAPFIGGFKKELVRNGKKTPSLHKAGSNPEG